MIDEVRKYPTHYGILVTILAMGTSLVLVLRYHPTLRPLTIYGLAVSYMVWGVMHHAVLGHLRFRVIIEYVLVAILGMAIVSTLI